MRLPRPWYSPYPCSRQVPPSWPPRRVKGPVNAEGRHTIWHTFSSSFMWNASESRLDGQCTYEGQLAGPPLSTAVSTCPWIVPSSSSSPYVLSVPPVDTDISSSTGHMLSTHGSAVWLSHDRKRISSGVTAAGSGASGGRSRWGMKARPTRPTMKMHTAATTRPRRPATARHSGLGCIRSRQTATTAARCAPPIACCATALHPLRRAGMLMLGAPSQPGAAAGDPCGGACSPSASSIAAEGAHAMRAGLAFDDARQRRMVSAGAGAEGLQLMQTT